MGDKGTMIIDEEGYRVWAEPWKKNPEPIYKEDAPVPVESHVQNFFDCMKSRQDPTCTLEIAAAAVAGPHLANLAMFQERKVELASDGVTVS